MDSDARDLELEWLKARIELSNRALSRMLDAHYELVRRAKLTGHLTDALRGKIRKYMEEHPGGGEDSSQQEDESTVECKRRRRTREDGRTGRHTGGCLQCAGRQEQDVRDESQTVQPGNGGVSVVRTQGRAACHGQTRGETDDERRAGDVESTEDVRMADEKRWRASCG